MKGLRLYTDVVERWALVSTGLPAFGRRGGQAKGWIAAMPDGTHRFRRPAGFGRPMVDELAEIRPFAQVVIAQVDESGPEPALKIGALRRVRAL